MIKTKLTIFILIFIFSAPCIAKAELSPQASFREECKQAFDGEIINDGNIEICKLPNNKLCATEFILHDKKYKDYANCDNLTDRKCSELGRNTRYGQTCCGDLVEIKEKSAFGVNCENSPIMMGPAYVNICTACGDGACGDYETKCNCPKDCLVPVVEEKTKEKSNIFSRFMSWIRSIFPNLT